ncbi:MAG: DNA translocase FtsK, partial [bacterium]
MARKKQISSRKPAAGVMLLVISLLLTLSYLPRATGLAITLGRWQRLLLGEAAVLLPLVAGGAGLYLHMAGGQARFTLRFAAVISLALAGITAYHARIAPGLEFVAAPSGSGLLGGGLVWVLRMLLGEIGMWLIVSLAVLAGVVFGSGASLSEWREILGRGFATLLGVIWASGVAIATGFARLGHLLAARLFRPTGVPATEPPIPVVPRDEIPETITRPLQERRPAPPVAPVPVRPPADAAPKTASKQESLELEAPSGGYQLPAISLLADLPGMRGKGKAEPSEVARALEQTLASFGVEAKVLRWEQGPVVTRFEVQPAPGVRVQRISSLTNDIALALAAPSVRIEAPIPGKSAVGIELPNQKTSLVHIKEILASEEY